jgi:hypothetical protein
MAIVFSYPPIGKNDVQPSDRLLLSQMTIDGNPTRSVTVNTLRQYLGAIIPTNIVTGVGITNRLARWTNGPGGVIGNSGITDDGVAGVKIPYAVDIENATSTANGIRFNHPAGGASGIVNMYYNGAAAGSRFVISRAATGGAEIELQSNGDVNINRLGNGNFLVGGEVTLDDYGAGTITGTPTFYLAVDVNGKVIEETSAGGIGGAGTINTLPVFTAANAIGDSMVSQNVGATIASINGELTMNTNKITDLAGPVLGTDAVNKNYVDTETTAVKTALGYRSTQVFQWVNGSPVAYVNFPIGTTSAIPFDTTPLVETGTYSGTAADFAWTCANQAGGTATQFAVFTVGPQAAGTWQIDVAQHWFDQNQFLEVNVDIQINATSFTVINERVNDGAGDRLFYGSIVREFTPGNTVIVNITFANGTGSNPFPAATGNRPIEITFTKLV